MMKFSDLFRRVLCAVSLCFCLAACSDSPADVVKKDFLETKSLTGAQLKERIQEQAESVYQKTYREILADDPEPDSPDAKKYADEEAAKDRDRVLAPYKNFDDARYEREARRNVSVYSGAKIKILGTEINGDKAVVSYEIAYAGGLKEKGSRKLGKNSGGKWFLLPPEEPKADEEPEAGSESESEK